MDIACALETARDRLTLHSETPSLDAQVLLAHLLDQPRAWLMAHPEHELAARLVRQLETTLDQLEAGEPLPYVLGHWEFYGLDLQVTPDVLIPRPETELLVEHAVRWLQAHPGRRCAADVGTGSGCIAVALAAAVPDLQVLATDISRKALRIARHNARRHGVTKRVRVAQYDLLPAPPPPSERLDLICANLPYIPTETLHELEVYGREPELALDGGADGLQLIRRLLELLPGWLAPGGLALLEIEASQGMMALSLAVDTFSEARVRLHQDLAGRDRLVTIETLIAE